MLVDTHTHLDAERFDEDRAAAITRARAAGVGLMVNVGCDLDSSRRSLDLARTHADILATVGVHPHEAKLAPVAFDDLLVALAADARCVAIGECGLDYHYMHSPRETQRDVFARQIGAARRANKPLVLHIRSGEGGDAFAEAIEILEAEGARDIGGVFHCFTGTLAEGKRALDLGFYLSMPGVVTFAKAGELAEVAKMAPNDRIVVETDAPYLAPVPHRGRRNEPSFVAHTAAFVAELRGEPLPAFIERTGENAARLFRLPL
jgi:TatD DNase family protein